MDLMKGGLSLYRQVAAIIRKRIESKEYQVQIPPENVLTNEFKVSRFTIRQALEVLKSEGLAYAKQGVGTLLTRQDGSKYGMLTGAFEDLVYYASESTVKLLQQKILPAPGEVAEKLKISTKEKIFCYTTLRYFKKHPFSYSHIYVPYSLGLQIPLAELRVKPVFKLIEEYCAVSIFEANHRISAVAAEGELTKVLKVKKGEPMLLVHRIYQAADGRPVELSVVFYDVKKLEYTIHLRRQANLDNR
ncbi:MAG: GntR family transcriptional regulator [Thermodesulfobacteriota bacterium]|nr:GntR family transcriptional regulator [Thermodesulfobacteriota bacterium]